MKKKKDEDDEIDSICSDHGLTMKDFIQAIEKAVANMEEQEEVTLADIIRMIRCKEIALRKEN